MKFLSDIFDISTSRLSETPRRSIWVTVKAIYYRSVAPFSSRRLGLRGQQLKLWLKWFWSLYIIQR